MGSMAVSPAGSSGPTGGPTTQGGNNPNAQPQFVEEPANYVFQYTLTANQVAINIPVNIDRDSDFCLTGLNGSSTGTFTMNFRLPSGRLICSQNVQNTNLLGTANIPTTIGPPPIYRAGSTGPELSLTDTSGAGNTVTIVFSGVRRLRTQ
jgi:hypothetical protein